MRAYRETAYTYHQLIANSIEFIKTDGRGFDGDQNDETPF